MLENANGTSELEPKERVPIIQPDEKTLEKLDILTDLFSDHYRRKPSFIVRVPGRVNLIGEHVDYCGYAVCPMAIEQDIIIAVAPYPDEIHIVNMDFKYKPFGCNFEELNFTVKEPMGFVPMWYKYFLCGVKGALEVIPKECKPMGFVAAVWGNIPPNSGLSSSSALVSAALLLTMHLNKQPLSKRELATISARAERYVGTMGGGMDQAIAFLGKPGSAMLIEFDPVRGTDVTLPETAVFVIAHSQACHNKASTGDFNLRVVECHLAALMIAKKRSIPLERVRRLIDVQEQLGMNLEEMVSVVTTDLHEEPYTMDEVSKNLDTTNDKLRKLLGGFKDSQTFKLKQRALHVYQEAARVREFQRVSADSSMMEEEKLQRLGSLMCKSHESLQKLYECSHPSVDALVEKAMSYGALGARLTGAGWGGCIVAIITKDKVSQFLDKLKTEFVQCGIKRGFELNDLVFPTEPNQGAVIYTT
ncbi:N-acetylgalactosamine kinase isoform X1 [Osmia lignaria lignaria]|uniref:N-acetylgalactosamine kinase isoform X1 n=1 Tax=Osmia lignaria lignaria TaxID=1437193 RepID=UPI00402B120C